MGTVLRVQFRVPRLAVLRCATDGQGGNGVSGIARRRDRVRFTTLVRDEVVAGHGAASFQIFPCRGRPSANASDGNKMNKKHKNFKKKG